MTSVYTMHQLALERMPFSLVISNPNIDDNPIVFVNAAFTALTGYSPEVCIGRNCRFLQGPATDGDALQALRAGLKRGEEFTVELLNYRADGTPFRNRILISPLKEPDGTIQFFVGLQRAVGSKVAADAITDGVDEALREIHHRVKNHLSDGDRHDPDAGPLAQAGRARELRDARPPDRDAAVPLPRDDDRRHDVGVREDDLARRLRVADRVSHRLTRRARGAAAQPRPRRRKGAGGHRREVGLLVSELLTNAYQHAFKERAQGLIEVRLYQLTDGTVRIQVADDGVGLPDTSRWPDGGNLGGRIVRSLLTGLGANLGIAVGGRGCTFTVDIPPENMSEDVADHPGADRAAPADAIGIAAG